MTKRDRAYYRFVGLSGSMVKQKIITEEEADNCLDAAKTDGTTNDIYETALTNLIRLINTRLHERGRRYGQAGTGVEVIKKP